MSVKRGTASNFLDLVEKLDSFLTAQGHAWGRTYAGTGNGKLLGTDGTEGSYIGGASSVAETFTIAATSATAFTVVGSVSGALAGATVGTPYTGGHVNFLIQAGATPFVAGDTFTLNTTPPWVRLTRTGVLEEAFRTGVNFTNVQNAYSSSSNYAVTTALPAELRLQSVWAMPVAEYFITCDTIATAPTAWTLDYSDDGSTWITADTRTGQSWTVANTARSFQVPGSPGAHRYWRLRITAGPAATRIFRFQLKTDIANSFTVEDGAFIAWRAMGADGAQEINIAARLYSNQASGIYNLRWYGSRFWDGTKAPESQVNTSGERVMSVYDNPMPFTFVANGHRLVPVVKVGTFYMAAYLGHRRSYDPPSADPWPCVIAANHNVFNQSYTVTSPRVRNFWNAGHDSMVAHYPNGAWVNFSNINDSSGSDAPESAAAYPGKVYPSALGITGQKLEYVRENIDGTYTLIPCALVCDNPRHSGGELDGVYWVTGFSNTAENVMVRDGFSHLCFPNVNRTGGADFAAIRLD